MSDEEQPRKPTPPEYQGYYQSTLVGKRDHSGSKKDTDVSKPKHQEEREFIETCYRHFNALAVTYKRRLDELKGNDE